jgi:hypothetical protein
MINIAHRVVFGPAATRVAIVLSGGLMVASNHLVAIRRCYQRLKM